MLSVSKCDYLKKSSLKKHSHRNTVLSAVYFTLLKTNSMEVTANLSFDAKSVLERLVPRRQWCQLSNLWLQSLALVLTIYYDLRIRAEVRHFH